MSKRYYICYECGYKFETEDDQLRPEDPKDCPACHSTNITVYAVRLSEENTIPIRRCEIPSGNT